MDMTHSVRHIHLLAGIEKNIRTRKDNSFKKD